MASFIPSDFSVSDQSYKNLARHGVFKDFIDDQLDVFLTYWLELKEKKSEKGKKESWQATLQVWMRRAFKGKAGRDWEYNRHRREDSGQGCLSFADAYTLSKEKYGGANYKIDVPLTSSTGRIVYTPIPGEGETMSEETALDALAEFRRSNG